MSMRKVNKMEFSLIVPVFNTEPAYFHKCMDSILNQDYEGDYEVILVDDGSAADIGRICDWYQQKDPRITVVHQENRGVSEARNEGIRRAGGDWLYFIDPDDWIELNALSSAAAILGKYSPDILYVAYQEDLPNASIPYRYGWSGWQALDIMDKERIGLGLLDRSYNSLPCCFGSVCTQFFKVEFLKKNHLRFLPQLRRMQDTMFNLYFLDAASSLSVMDQVVYHYRKNPQSICNRYNPAIQEYILEFNKVLYQYIQGKSEDWARAFEFKAARNYCEILRLYYLNPNWAADRKQKKARWEQLIRHTAYARYLGKDSYKRVLKKSRGYAAILFLTYNIPSFFLLGCFWKAYNRIR